jgi:hypothetical protein
VPRGLAAAGAADAGHGRFGRMFGFLPARELSAGALDTLVELIGASETGPNPSIPAGYTYFAQFVDHDLTFDPTSRLDKVNDPLALVNFRTPRLDLDSLYGSGPDDQPFLYESRAAADSGVKLLVGANPPDGAQADTDLPRNTQGRALTGDHRNDENLILAQLHLLFILFHNRVVDYVREQRGLSGGELFEEAQRIVRWHYQWIVAHDFLPRIVGQEMAARVLISDVTAERVQRRFYRWRGRPFIPVEFSGAAYRFGHSMVRDLYEVNARAGDLPVFSSATAAGELGDLRGFRPLPAALEIEWERFFEVAAERPPQSSFALDTGIAPALRHLPVEVSDEPELPRLNMRRGAALGLPSGRDVARAMAETPLTEQQLRFHVVPAGALRDELMRAVPLWYYVLREAKELHHGAHLGPVGGRIVAEVLLGLIEGDPSSYISQWPAWRPELPPHAGDFTMADVVRFTRGAPAPPPP